MRTIGMLLGIPESDQEAIRDKIDEGMTLASGEMPSADYTLLKSPYPDQKLVHIYPDPEELGRVFRPTVAINATPAAFAEAFSHITPSRTPVWRTVRKSFTRAIWNGRRRPPPGRARC